MLSGYSFGRTRQSKTRPRPRYVGNLLFYRGKYCKYFRTSPYCNTANGNNIEYFLRRTSTRRPDKNWAGSHMLRGQETLFLREGSDPACNHAF